MTHRNAVTDHLQGEFSRGKRRIMVAVTRRLWCGLFGSGLVSLSLAIGAQSAKRRPVIVTETADARASKPSRYVDAESKMSFVPPAGWQRSSQAPPATIVYVAPGDRKSAANIGLISAPVGDETMEQFFRSNRDYAAQIRGLTVYDRMPATLAGAKAMAWRIHVQPPKGAPHETRQIFCVHNRRSYVITLAGLPSSIHKYDRIFDKVIASFHWEN